MDYDRIIDLQNVTVEDCLNLFKNEGFRTIINDGHIINFTKESMESN